MTKDYDHSLPRLELRYIMSVLFSCCYCGFVLRSYRLEKYSTDYDGMD